MKTDVLFIIWGSLPCPLQGHFQIPVGMVVRGGIRQSRYYPALQMLRRSVVSSSNGLRHTWQCASSGRGVGGLVVGRQRDGGTSGLGGSGIELNKRISFVAGIVYFVFVCRIVFLAQLHSNT